MATCWDRTDDLFKERSPSTAVIFLHGEGDSGAGLQAELGHACAHETDDFEEAAASLGAAVLFPDAPGVIGADSMRNWLSR
jgi:hypothetical protein